ncbi:MAG: hypothetical protein ACXWCZ_03750 [Flavisolibacter sp.]
MRTTMSLHMTTNGSNPFIDPQGYRQRTVNERKKFNDENKKDKELN